MPFCTQGKFSLVPISDAMEGCGQEPHEEVGQSLGQLTKEEMAEDSTAERVRAS